VTDAPANRLEATMQAEIEALTDEERHARKLARQRRYRANHADRVAAYRVAWRAAHVDRARAHRTIWKAVRSGRLTSPGVCGECGTREGIIDAHHDDYTRRLDVRWLCRPCHRKAHKALRRALPPPSPRNDRERSE
jgi:hypothetical protein